MYQKELNVLKVEKIDVTASATDTLIDCRTPLFKCFFTKALLGLDETKSDIANASPG